MSRHLWKAITAGVLFITAVSIAQTNEYYFKFAIGSHNELEKITNVISIDNVRGDTVYAYASTKEFVEFGSLGYSITLLQHPGTLISPKMAGSPDMLAEWDVYPTYPAYVTMMNNFAANHPDLCVVYNIGTTIQGRSLLVARLSANVNTEENEPELLYSGTMHGDETTGYVLLLRLIDYLLTNYGTDPEVTSLLNSMEIWINPLANPDGTYHNGDNSVTGATRGNANGVDLNRNFPDPANGPHPDGNSWQPETQAMMDFAVAHSFVLSANFHGGAEVVNYPWDSYQRLHADDGWFINISRKYADTVHVHSPSGYMTDLDNGITNGYAWYPVHGGRQDYMTYFKGGREVTIELSTTKLLPAGQLPAHWNYNFRSLVNYIKSSLYGIKGRVTDASTGQPVAAIMWVLNHDADSSRVFTDPNIGDYHRMLSPGTYDIRFTAIGYYAQTVNGVIVTSNSGTTVNVQLQPVPIIPDLAFLGHNAGAIHPGDTIAMAITLINNGGGNATGVNAILSTSDSFINIIQGASSFPAIAANGGTGVSSGNYSFAVSPSCPSPHQVAFLLDITASGGYSDTALFNLTVGQDIENFESGNFASYPWQFGGNANWGIVGTGVYEGTYSAKSGTITHNQNSELSITFTVAQAGNISFYYKVSSEVSYDSLRFLVDGTLRQGWSGEVGWAQSSHSLGIGTHTIKWIYKKDGSLSRGSDCAWIDYIVFPLLAEPLVINTASLPDWTANHPYSQQLQAAGGVGSKTWSDQYNNLPGTGLTLSTSGLLSGSPVGPDTIAFTARVQDQASNAASRQYTFIINAPLAITTDTLPHAATGQPYSGQINATGGTGNRNWSDLNSELAGTGLVFSISGLVSGTPTITSSVSFTASVADAVGASSQRRFTIILGDDYIPGDANADGDLRGSDDTYMVGYFKGRGPAPEPLLAGDANGDCEVNGGDVTYMVRYFKGFGDPPIRGNCR